MMTIGAITTTQIISITTLNSSSTESSAAGDAAGGTLASAEDSTAVVGPVAEIGDVDDIDGFDDIEGIDEIEGEEDEESEETKIRGVLLQILDGHFSGVAALRLRINFAEELAELRAERVEAAVEEGAESVVGAVGSALDELSQSGDLTDDQGSLVVELESAFADAVDEASGQFIEDGGDTDPAALQAGLQEAFDVFSASLSDALSTTETDAASTETADESTSELSAAFQVFLADLAETFAAELESLASSIEAAGAEPEPSEPHGNGRAYAKFLAIYEAQSSAGAAEPTEEPAPIDVVA